MGDIVRVDLETSGLSLLASENGKLKDEKIALKNELEHMRVKLSRTCIEQAPNGEFNLST